MGRRRERDVEHGRGRGRSWGGGKAWDGHKPGSRMKCKGKSKSWFAELVLRLIWFHIKDVLGDKKGNGKT